MHNEAIEVLREYVPNFVENFVDNELVDIIKIENQEDKFLILSWDNYAQKCFMVGFIDKNDDEDKCFSDQHRCFDDYQEAVAKFKELRV